MKAQNGHCECGKDRMELCVRVTKEEDTLYKYEVKELAERAGKNHAQHQAAV